jgi:site-specific DNA recombinase
MKISKTAILYIRTASQKEKKIKTSFLRQENCLLNYCNRNKLEIVKIVKECDSGLTFNRIVFSKLITDLKLNDIKADYLLFSNWFRFSRNFKQTQDMVLELKKLGIIPIAVKEKYDEKKLISQEENFLNNIIIKKPKALLGNKVAKQNGRWLGQAPVGYKNITDNNNLKTIIPNEMSKQIINLFILFSSGKYNLKEITREFNKTPPIYSMEKVKMILENPFYCGTIKLKTNENEIEDIDGAYAPLISREIFSLVQQKIHQLNNEEEE